MLRPRKRRPDGSFVDLPYVDALDEIAGAMRRIIDEHGPAAIGAYRGTAMAMSSVSCPFLPDWLASFGSTSFFTTLTIDQVAKFVVPDILGRWEAGRTHLLDADVLMLVGTNPVVSATGIGFVNFHPVRRLREARERGVKIIVVDPRRTETSAYADVFLQPYPGEDSIVAAGLVRAILVNGWQDDEFCAGHVEPGQLDALRAAVEPFTPEAVERRSGVPAAELLDAARVWSGGRRGLVNTGTGMSMGYASNLSEHLYEALEVLCGLLPQVGEPIRKPGVTAPRLPSRAQAVTPTRHWEALPPSRIRGAGSVARERTCSTLADEILTPGDGQLRGLFTFGGNPAAAVPDRRKITRSLAALDLLAILARNGQVPFEEIRAEPDEAFFDVTQAVEPPDPVTAGRFHVLPTDMAERLDTLADEPMSPQHRWRDGRPFTHTLASRRLREVYNSFGPQLSELHKKRPYNPAYLHPDDLAELGLAPGDRVWIESAHDTITGIVDRDPALKPGVVSMAHGWGRNPGAAADHAVDGSSTSLLIADDHACDTIHVQPRMSGIPVNVLTADPTQRAATGS